MICLHEACANSRACYPILGRELAKANIAEAALKLNEAQELAKLKTKYNEKLEEDTSSGEEWEDVHGMVHQGYSCSDFHGEEDQERTNVRPTTSLPNVCLDRRFAGGTRDARDTRRGGRCCCGAGGARRRWWRGV